MAENRSYNDSPTFIPARLESSVHSSIPGNGNKGPVADAKDIYDINNGKWQKDINDEVEAVPAEIERIDGELEERYTKNETYNKTEVDTKESGLQGQINTIKGGSTKSIATIDNQINGNNGIDERLQTVEALGEISVGGGDIQIATGADFDDPDASQKAKAVTVGAVLGGIINTPVLDLTSYTGDTYADLNAALTAMGDVSFPAQLKKGGMSIKFVSSVDNTYMQFRLMADEWSTNTNIWAVCAVNVLTENPEWAEVVTDCDSKILYGIKKDGNFYFGDGCPTQVKEYVLPLINKKVDKINGKSLIDEDFAAAQTTVDSTEYQKVLTDSDEKIIEGVRKNGEKDVCVKTNFKDSVETPSVIIETKKDNEWIDVKTDIDGKVIEGIRKDGIKVINGIPFKDFNAPINDIGNYLQLYPEVSGDFTAEMSKSEFVSLYNEKLPAFCSLCKCQVYGMNKLSNNDSIEVMCEKINHNFRSDVVTPGMSWGMFVSQVNRYLSIPIYRFADAKLNSTDTVNASLKVAKDGVQFDGIGEPSALISDDGLKIELFSSQNVYTESSDGVNWATPQTYNFHDNTWSSIAGHRSINKVDGVYMMVAHTRYNNNTEDYFDLLISEDKLNFYYKGHLFKNNHTDIGSGKVTTVLGNTYLFRDNDGKYYLIYEARIPDIGRAWDICLMSCTDILSPQSDGFIGDWVQCPTNPVLAFGDYPCCNPEIVKGEDNKPLRYDGKFYMYYLSYWNEGNEWTTERVATIRRAFSTDLVNWTDEGIVFDNRDTPDGGEHNADNGDQCMCQFRGRSYFFYSHNINNYGEGTYPVPMSIRYTIDDRPFTDLLKIRP